jgi:hypothetical protein
MNSSTVASVAWKGPDFRDWWSEGWRERVGASLAEGIARADHDHHFIRIRNAFLTGPQVKAELTDFLSWVNQARGLMAYAVGVGVMRHPLAASSDQARRLFPELEIDWQPSGQRCWLLRFAADRPYRTRLLVLVRQDEILPLASGRGSFDAFSGQLEQAGVYVDWEVDLGDIRLLADEVKASDQENEL